MAIVGGIAGMIFAKAEEMTQKSYSGAGTVATEAIGGMRTVQSFNFHTIMVFSFASSLSFLLSYYLSSFVQLEKCRVKITEAMKVAIKKGFYSGLTIGSAYFIFFCTYSLSFWYGGKLYIDGVCNNNNIIIIIFIIDKVNHGDAETGDILIVIMCVIIASFVLGSMATNFDSVAKGKAAASDFFTIIDRHSIIDFTNNNGIKPSNYDGSFHLENVHFRYTFIICDCLSGGLIIITESKSIGWRNYI